MKKLLIAGIAVSLSAGSLTLRADDKSTQEGQTSERYNQTRGSSLPASEENSQTSESSSEAPGAVITESAGAEAAKNGNLSSEDSKFIQEAAKDGKMEIEMGKLGVEKAHNPEVKKLAQRIMDDHTKANAELKEIAQEKGIQLAEGAHKHSAVMAEYLKDLSGAEFDRAYVKHMIQDHQKDIKAFEKQAQSGQDSRLKEFASKTLPTLQEHLAMAKGLSSNRAAGEIQDPSGADSSSQDKSSTDDSSSDRSSQPTAPEPYKSNP